MNEWSYHEVNLILIFSRTAIQPPSLEKPITALQECKESICKCSEYVFEYYYNYKKWTHQFPRSTAAKKFEDTRPIMEQQASDMSEF